MNLAKRLAVIGILVLVFGTVLIPVNVPKLYLLSRDGKSIQAKVTKLNPQDHDMFEFEYDVAGKKYKGYGFLTDMNVQEGEAINILYSPYDPSLSIAGNPRSRLVNELISIGVALAIFPIVILYSFELIYKWIIPRLRRV